MSNEHEEGEQRNSKKKKVPLFASIQKKNESLRNAMQKADGEFESRKGLFTVEDDEDARDARADFNLAQELYKDLTFRKGGALEAAARNMPLPRFLSPIRERDYNVELLQAAEGKIRKSTDTRSLYSDICNYAFRPEEPYFLPSVSVNSASGAWRVHFNLLSTSHSQRTWEDVWGYSEKKFEDWWKQRQLKIHTDSTAWFNLRTLCRCVVFILDVLFSKNLEKFPSRTRILGIAQSARRLAVQFVLLHEKYPHQDYGISILFGLTAPVVFALWNTVEAAKKARKDTDVILSLASDVLASSLDELERLMAVIQDLVSEFRAVLSKNPYTLISGEDGKQSDHIFKPSVSQLFNGDVTDLISETSGTSDQQDRTDSDYNMRSSSTDIIKSTLHFSDSEFGSRTKSRVKCKLTAEELECMGLTRIVIQNARSIIGHGASSIISTCASEDGTNVYAVKSYRSHIEPNLIKRESSIWVKLDHPNILPLLGYCEEPEEPFPSLVTSLCTDGNLEYFLQTRPQTEKKRLSFLHDIASAVRYLHSINVAHGDLRAANVLVQKVSETTETRAVVCDFGISEIVVESEQRLYNHSAEQKTLDSWLAPELLFANENILARVSKEGDMYAFGCVILEVMFKKKPYGSYADHLINEAKQEGRLPARKAEMNDRYWLIAKECWLYECGQRATSSWVLSKLGNLLHHSEL